MLISMTGFGRAIREASFGRLVVEVQSVNRKFLEIFISLPKELTRFEVEIRKWVSEIISRGQVSVRFFLSPSEEALRRSLPDPELLKRLKEAWSKIAEKAGVGKEGIDLAFLLEHLPALSPAELASSEGEYLAALKECTCEALEQALGMKKSEGKALEKDILGRLNELEKIVKSIEQLSPDATAKLREKLKERIVAALEPGAELDERILREVAFFAERVDLSEEIARLSSHLAQAHGVLRAKETSVGRKLEFILQEMGREINTIGSKASDASISKLVVDAKSEMEKVREQIQNIE